MVQFVRHHELTNTVGYEGLQCYTHISHLRVRIRNFAISVCQ